MKDIVPHSCISISSKLNSSIPSSPQKNSKKFQPSSFVQSTTRAHQIKNRPSLIIIVPAPPFPCKQSNTKCDPQRCPADKIHTFLGFFTSNAIVLVLPFFVCWWSLIPLCTQGQKQTCKPMQFGSRQNIPQYHMTIQNKKRHIIKRTHSHCHCLKSIVCVWMLVANVASQDQFYCCLQQQVHALCCSLSQLSVCIPFPHPACTVANNTNWHLEDVSHTWHTERLPQLPLEVWVVASSWGTRPWNHWSHTTECLWCLPV